MGRSAEWRFVPADNKQIETEILHVSESFSTGKEVVTEALKISLPQHCSELRTNAQ